MRLYVLHKLSVALGGGDQWRTVEVGISLSDTDIHLQGDHRKVGEILGYEARIVLVQQLLRMGCAELATDETQRLKQLKPRIDRIRKELIDEFS